MTKLLPRTTGCKICGDPASTRGLCSKHYKRFTRKKNAIKNEAEAEAFEEKCIADGWIDESEKGGRPKEVDPFDEVLREVQAEFTRDINKAVTRERAAEAKKAELDAAKKAKQATKRKAN